MGSVAALVCTATVTPTPASARESSPRTRMGEVGGRLARVLRNADAHEPELGQAVYSSREAMFAVPLAACGSISPPRTPG